MSGTGLIDEIKSTFKHGSMLTRLIYINLAVFIAVNLIDAITFLLAKGDSNFLLNLLQVPAQLEQILMHPWSLLTYMFLHHDFIHILFNLLWLFWLGKIFLEYFNGRQLLTTYLLGGLFGAFTYILAYNLFPVFHQVVPVSYALGASASVLAIVVATATYVPNYTIYLLFLGPVKLKYIALFSILLDVVTLKDGNAGGHIAHLGGAFFGYLYASQLRKGTDLGKGFGKMLDAFASWFRPKKKLKVTYRRGETDLDYNYRKKVEQQEIDSILEKIARSGYENLSTKEKELLFRQSRKS